MKVTALSTASACKAGYEAGRGAARWGKARWGKARQHKERKEKQGSGQGKGKKRQVKARKARQRTPSRYVHKGHMQYFSYSIALDTKNIKTLTQKL